MHQLFISVIIFTCNTWANAADFIWPTEGKVISAFDPTRKGIDIAGQAGQPILATADGKVLYAKAMRGYGNLVILEHSGGMVTAYAHNKTILVREGQTVSQKQQIAEMGNTGTNMVKLSFQMRQMGKPVDPMRVLPPQIADVTSTGQQSNLEDGKGPVSTRGIGLATITWKFVPTDLNERMWGHEKTVFDVAFSPDGQQVLSGSADRSAVLRDIKTGKTIHSWEHKDWVNCVAFSPDGHQVMTGSADRTAVLRDIKTGNTIHTWGHKGKVSSIAFSPDGRQVITGSDDDTAVLRNTATGNTLQTWKLNSSVRSFAFSPDGQQIVMVLSTRVIVVETKTGQILQNREHKYPEIVSVAFSPNGRQLLSASYSRETRRNPVSGFILPGLGSNVILRDAITGQILQTWNTNEFIEIVAFSPDGRRVLTRSDYSVDLRDANTGQELQTFKSDDTIRSAAFSPDGSQVLMGNSGSVVALKQSGLGVELQRALITSLNQAETEYRSLPISLLNRQSRLETDKPVKDEFETVAQFNHRVSQWNKAAEVLNADIQAHFAKLGTLPLAKRARAFERAFIQSYGNPKLQDISYEPETARFFATLTATLDPEFKRVVSFTVPNDRAKAVKAQLVSDKNGLEVELRVTERNELLWGEPRVRIDDKLIVAQFVDKNFIPPSTSMLASDFQLKAIALPSIATVPQSPNIKVIEDPALNKLQMEVLQKEREQVELAARQAEEKRLRDRLAELNRQTKTEYNDDLPGLLSMVPAPKPNPRLHVLAIGINDYADVPDVPFADRSAQQFAAITQKLLGAQAQNVIVLTDSNATLGRILSRFNTLLNRLGPDDQLLFYYAGHGVPGKDGASAYLLAQDGGPGSYEQPELQLNRLYALIAKSRVGEAKLFIDACFSGRSSKDTLVFEGIAPITLKPKQNFPDSQRLAVITAGRGDQFSNQDKPRGHRLFSYHLMRVLLEDHAKLEIAQLYRRLRESVLNESRRIGPEFEQEPDLQGNGQMVIVH